MNLRIIITLVVTQITTFSVVAVVCEGYHEKGGTYVGRGSTEEQAIKAAKEMCKKRYSPKYCADEYQRPKPGQESIVHSNYCYKDQYNTQQCEKMRFKCY